MERVFDTVRIVVGKTKFGVSDTPYRKSGARGRAYYAHVTRGNYAFRAIAVNKRWFLEYGRAENGITERPLLYWAWWFMTLTSMGIAGMVSFLWRGRVAQLKMAQGSQRLFARQLIASQESERKRIAAELHDSLGQRLVVIKNLALLSLRASSGASGANADELHRIEEISAEASQAIREVKEISSPRLIFTGSCRRA